jgi:hypothetical protein
MECVVRDHKAPKHELMEVAKPSHRSRRSSKLFTILS